MRMFPFTLILASLACPPRKAHLSPSFLAQNGRHDGADIVYRCAIIDDLSKHAQGTAPLQHS